MRATEIEGLWRATLAGTLHRRELLKRAAALGLTAPVIAGLLAACGSSDKSTATTSSSTSESGASGTTAAETPASGTGTPSAASSATAGSSGKAGGGGDVRLLYWQAPTILNPHFSQGTKDWHASRVALEPLADFDTDGSMILVLAAEEPTLDNGMVGHDGKSVTWKLRQGVKWQDGEPFTAKDVKFTYEFVSDEATAATSYASYSNIASIDTPDDFTVTIHFKQPEPGWTKSFTGNLGMILPEHLLSSVKHADARNAPYNLKPVGTGPFQVSSFTPGDAVNYEINPHYWDAGKPYFDRVSLKGGGDAASAARAVLQTGEIDWSWNLQVEPTVLDTMTKGGTGKLVTWPGGGTEVLLMNHADPTVDKDGQKANKAVPHPHLAVKEVRQAIAASIQRDQIAKQLYGAGGAVSASTINTPTNLVPQDISWEFDLDKAKQLLESAGATDGSPRQLNGRPMSWIYQTTVNSVRQKIQELVKNSLSEIGINVELKTIDSSVFFSADPGNTETVSHFYADLEMYNTGPQNIFPIAWYERYLASASAQKENSWSGANYARYENPQFDTLFNQVSTELDPKKATDLFLQMQRLVWQEAAEIALVATNHVAGASSKLTGYKPTAWRPDVADIANWRMS